MQPMRLKLATLMNTSIAEFFNVQFYTKCAVLKALCAALERYVCRLHCIPIKKRDSSYSRVLSTLFIFQKVRQKTCILSVLACRMHVVYAYMSIPQYSSHEKNLQF